jgi:hypothetical protein
VKSSDHHGYGEPWVSWGRGVKPPLKPEFKKSRVSTMVKEMSESIADRVKRRRVEKT